jgi:hypothetical protein
MNLISLILQSRSGVLCLLLSIALQVSSGDEEFGDQAQIGAMRTNYGIRCITFSSFSLYF